MTNAKLLTIKEVAEYLFDNQNRDAYYRARNLIKKHKLQEITVGRRIYVQRSAIDAAVGLDSVPDAGPDKLPD